MGEILINMYIFLPNFVIHFLTQTGSPGDIVHAHSNPGKQFPQKKFVCELLQEPHTSPSCLDGITPKSLKA